MQTTMSGPAKPAGDLYLPTDVSPEELFQAIGRLRKEAQDEIERLLAFLDSIDDCDEDSAVDDAPCDTYGQDEEHGGDDEPSLGSCTNGETSNQECWGATASDDLEDEHDGREPEDEHGDNADMEPSLGWPEANGAFGGREEVRQ